VKPLSCQELVELVTDYLDGTLSRRDRRRFESHIAGCGNCTRYLEQFRQTIAVAGTLHETDVDATARDELLTHFANWKRERT